LGNFAGKDVSVTLTVTKEDYQGNKAYYNSCCAYGWVKTVYDSLINSQNNTQYKEMTKINNVVIGGVPGVVFKVTLDHADEIMSTPALYAAFIKDDRAFLFNGVTGDRELIFQEPNTNIFNQIISSFKFTN
jgi:hypothetical protein